MLPVFGGMKGGGRFAKPSHLMFPSQVCETRKADPNQICETFTPQGATAGFLLGYQPLQNSPPSSQNLGFTKPAPRYKRQLPRASKPTPEPLTLPHNLYMIPKRFTPAPGRWAVRALDQRADVLTRRLVFEAHRLLYHAGGWAVRALDQRADIPLPLVLRLENVLLLGIGVGWSSIRALAKVHKSIRLKYEPSSEPPHNSETPNPEAGRWAVCALD